MKRWSKFWSYWPLKIEQSNTIGGYLLGMVLQILMSPASLMLSILAHAASRVLAKIKWLEKPAIIEWSF